jgi:hypothetical protein
VLTGRLETPFVVKDLVHNLVHTCIKTGSKRSQSFEHLNALEATQREVDIATSQTIAERWLTTDKGEVGGSSPPRPASQFYFRDVYSLFSPSSAATLYASASVG